MKNLNKYYIKNQHNSKIIEIVDKLDIDKFAKNYKISNFLKGKFFIKRLINKVFKYQLKSSITWNKYFWEKTDIFLVNISISYVDNHSSLNDFENSLNKNLTKRLKTKRLKDIYKYMDLIKKNYNLSYPLYITGECINELGGDVHNNELFLLDGTRRIIANILLDNKKIKAYIISKIKS